MHAFSFLILLDLSAAFALAVGSAFLDFWGE